MQRDLDLVRTILFELENRSHPYAERLNLDGYSAATVSYHVQMLYEAGFIDAKDVSHMQGHAWSPSGITWHGHEFLSAARNDNAWNRAKFALAKTGGFSLKVMQELLTKFVLQQLEHYYT